MNKKEDCTQILKICTIHNIFRSPGVGANKDVREKIIFTRGKIIEKALAKERT